MKKRLSIKQIFLDNQNWWRFYQQHHNQLRPAITIAIVKLLSCRHTIRGYQQYRCSNSTCTHTLRVPFTCKSKACSSCGKKATELWIAQQLNSLPNTSWQHITFTMPSELWDFFWFNRYLLNTVSKLAADCIQNLAQKKGVTPGIFTALHTFGRDLKRNVHVHLSTTQGGLTSKPHQWKSLFFSQSTLMRMWRYRVTELFRQAYQNQALILPPGLAKQINHTYSFHHFIDQLYQKTWIVHVAKPSQHHQHNVRYLARYLKRPPIAESRLKHYDGQHVIIRYLDRTQKTYRQLTLSSQQFIQKLVQHIPDVHFRMIRYYGFLAHRLRGQLLPIVYDLLKQPQPPFMPKPSYIQLMIKYFHFNPLTCLLCAAPMALEKTNFGTSQVAQLLKAHRPLALLKKC